VTRALKQAALAAARIAGLFALSTWLTRRDLRILCYHAFEIADESAFRPKMFMKPETFKRRMAMLKRLGFTVVGLDEGLDRVRRGVLGARTCAITIDDGFASVFRHAAPVLAELRWPATLYYTTYYGQKQALVYGLVVEYLFWKTRVARLDLSDVPDLPPIACDLARPDERQRAMTGIVEFGDRGSQELRDRLCRVLGQKLGVNVEDLVRHRQFTLMTPEELRALRDRGFDVQLHTHRHRFPMDDKRSAQDEIVTNRAVLEAWLPGRYRHFCYPSGEWAPHQSAWLDEIEVTTATTCLPGLVDQRSPRHGLPRFLDGEDVTDLEFEAELSGFTELLRRRVRGRGRAARPTDAHPVLPTVG
jgi:peptidoglycan/xylan/chitin deacetylase (PgdA/CDA1 family)